MELSEIIPHIEVLIFASEKPLTSLEIAELINNTFGFLEERITLDQVETAVEGIREKYSSEFYPFEIRESGGGWQFLTKKDFHKTIAQLNGDKFLKRLSNAALETLAIIAYKQPITKGEIEAIRGVNSDYSIQKLLEKELILISGRSEQLPGKPLVYSTSKIFMDYFGINNTGDLPKIKEVLAEQIVEGTIIRPEDFMTGQTAEEQSETVADNVAADNVAAENLEADNASEDTFSAENHGNTSADLAESDITVTEQEILSDDISDATVNEEGTLQIDNDSAEKTKEEEDGE